MSRMRTFWGWKKNIINNGLALGTSDSVRETVNVPFLWREGPAGGENEKGGLRPDPRDSSSHEKDSK